METPEIGSEVWKQIQLLSQPLSLLTQGPRMAMRAARIQYLRFPEMGVPRNRPKFDNFLVLKIPDPLLKTHQGSLTSWKNPLNCLSSPRFF
jgi:hypothetical protein